ncbi:nitrite reductase small subunit NirD [Shewanella gelidii]|uniref:Nitrite reductase small subunit n=1 Tax=Shewanella gelidii TaxID=1642821 RepID=A0A917NDX0_9GAMM|nr:nitrite reductase small subunit NirD [Shewanella gelidii]MCL1099370.1 nitrite reductase small subunit NirD [Shewanella gelidii]GGI91262.1 nitrite reductase small subunit [Shewanella gelidii]
MESWTSICQTDDLVPNTGVCALFNEEQVAVFHCAATDSLYAVSNYDPIGQANVLSRGIIGSIASEPVVASPLYKQHFSLKTGACLQQPDVTLKTYKVRRQGKHIQLAP